MTESNKQVLVSQLEMPEYIKMTREELLDRKWLPALNRHETYPEAYRRWKDEQKKAGTLSGWIEV